MISHIKNTHILHKLTSWSEAESEPFLKLNASAAGYTRSFRNYWNSFPYNFSIVDLIKVFDHLMDTQIQTEEAVYHLKKSIHFIEKKKFYRQ